MSYYAAGGFLEDVTMWGLKKVAPTPLVDVGVWAANNPWGSIGAFKAASDSLRKKLGLTPAEIGAGFPTESLAALDPYLTPTRAYAAPTKKRRTRRKRWGTTRLATRHKR